MSLCVPVVKDENLSFAITENSVQLYTLGIALFEMHISHLFHMM